MRAWHTEHNQSEDWLRDSRRLDMKFEYNERVKRMSGSNGVSPKTRTNWLIDAAVFGSALIAALSGIYFLFLPSGGYQADAMPSTA
jgi:hypothetical protein